MERLRERAFNIMAPNNSKLLFKPLDEEMSESLFRLRNETEAETETETETKNSRPHLPPGITWTNADGIVNSAKGRSNSFATVASDPGTGRSNSFSTVASDPGFLNARIPKGPKPQAVYNRRTLRKGGMRQYRSKKTRRYRYF